MFTCSHIITLSTSLSNETDLQALLDFKSRINLDPFGSLSSWNATSHFCTWSGIHCGRHDRVVAINLLSQGLIGTLSPHIGNLSFLRNITLRNNTFQGKIPQEISRLRRLEYIGLNNNSFVGPIPRNLSECQNLFYLNLGINSLSGRIPAELGLLHKLEVLILQVNSFVGNIPHSIGNLTSLSRLSLMRAGSLGEIPESLAGLRSLTYLSLAENHHTGAIPSGLFNLSTIYTFVVNNNELQGEIPSDLGLTLANLRAIYLNDNKFTGTVPVSLSNVSKLEIIVLLDNNFTGPVPRIVELFNLYIFNIAVNPIQDDISFISSLTNLTNLYDFEIGDNLLSGFLPDTLANLSISLEYLYIAYSDIYGKIPSGIGNLVSLTILDLSNNFLDGHIPSDIGKLHNLHELALEENRFSNELPSSFKNLTSLLQLSLQANNFSGGVKSLSSCNNLLHLDLSYNKFIGPIPPQIMNLTSISISLDLSRNAFSGSIPSEVGFLSNLMKLDLSNNRLSGLVPNSISSCRSLQQLHLEGNSVEGEIPQGLSGLMGLQDLDLSRNGFSGPIPSFLADMHLENLNLSHNRFQGEVPVEGVFRNKTAVSLDGNNGLCGGIHEVNLPPCSDPSKKKSTILLKILVPVICILFAVSLSFIIFFYRRKAKHLPSMPSRGTHILRLSYADLLKATDGFSCNNLIGSGRFGSVYKGILDDDQTVVAVKVLKLLIRGASKSFMAECNTLRSIRHRNLVKILSVCESIDFQGNGFKALVYEYEANGSLEKWLYCQDGENEEESTRKLSMLQRLKIAIDVAHAVEYLHNGTDVSIVHCDLKPSNILLDDDLNAFVGDFGLAKIISEIVPTLENNSSVFIRGTIGYVAPEYATNYVVSTQGDVYSYGILLLEMFTNKRPTTDAFEDHENLHSFVSSALPDYAMEIVDPLIKIEHEKNNKINECMISIMKIGVACSRTIPKDRMSMIDVVNELHKIYIRDFYTSG